MSKELTKNVKEIKDLVENVTQLSSSLKDSGFDWDKYVKLPHPRLDRMWVGIPAAGLLFIALVMALLTPIPEKWRIVLFIFGFSCCGWLTISTHLRYEKVTTTGVAGVFGILILLVASRFITPQEAAEQAINLMPGNNAQ
ncbi:MAG: hypothetical protein KAT62_14820 [Desulfuromonadales bacterium]|nr:hypothetical protein [Desulfuromonadales bacterium]